MTPTPAPAADVAGRIAAQRARRAGSVARLGQLDPTGFGIPLSAAMLRETWKCALAGFSCPPRGLDLRGRTVLVVGSANVYTALLPWMVLLTEAGANVRVKPARGQEIAARAIAQAIELPFRPDGKREGHLEILRWRGGEGGGEGGGEDRGGGGGDEVGAQALDDDAVGRAMRAIDAVIAFGGGGAIDALRTRAPVGAQFFGFGPRFGVCVAPDLLAGDVADRALRDALLYDGRGCMSPAALFTATSPRPAISRLMAALSDAEAWVKEPGPLSAVEAAETRTRVLLTRAAGGIVVQAQKGGQPDPHGPTLLYSPSHFRPFALPRVLVVHPMALLPAVQEWRAELGTVAGDAPALPALRRCAPGEMQVPVHDGTHEGIDVLAQIAALP